MSHRRSLKAKYSGSKSSYRSNYSKKTTTTTVKYRAPTYKKVYIAPVYKNTARSFSYKSSVSPVVIYTGTRSYTSAYSV
jgi:hypothetical protein